MVRVTTTMSVGRSQTSQPLPHMKTVRPAAVTNGRIKPWSLRGHSTLHAYVMPPGLSRQRTLIAAERKNLKMQVEDVNAVSLASQRLAPREPRRDTALTAESAW
jgi:hypothetical protein